MVGHDDHGLNHKQHSMKSLRKLEWKSYKTWHIGLSWWVSLDNWQNQINRWQGPTKLISTQYVLKNLFVVIAPQGGALAVRTLGVVFDPISLINIRTNFSSKDVKLWLPLCHWLVTRLANDFVQINLWIFCATTLYHHAFGILKANATFDESRILAWEAVHYSFVGAGAESKWQF